MEQLEKQKKAKHLPSSSRFSIVVFASACWNFSLEFTVDNFFLRSSAIFSRINCRRVLPSLCARSSACAQLSCEGVDGEGMEVTGERLVSFEVWSGSFGIDRGCGDSEGSNRLKRF